MRHSVVISYSSKDKKAADTICHALEARRVGCWIAPGDIVAGTEYAAAIVEAIETAKTLLVVFSSRTEASPFVRAEIERAVSNDTPVLLCRIEDVMPGKRLALFLNSHHWFDAFKRPFAQRMVDLADEVRRLLRMPVLPRTDSYMISRGPEAHRPYTGRPREPWDSLASGKLDIAALRSRLLLEQKKLSQPVPAKVRGTLFPCALLTSGWWESHTSRRTRQPEWRDGLQRWLFQGFDLWGPSWDFTWTSTIGRKVKSDHISLRNWAMATKQIHCPCCCRHPRR